MTAHDTPESVAARLRLCATEARDEILGREEVVINQAADLIEAQDATNRAQAAEIARLEGVEAERDMVLRELAVTTEEFVALKAEAERLDALLTAASKNLDGALAAYDASDADRQRMRETLTDEVVTVALQDAWDDYCGDANAFPHCFTILPRRRLMADFRISNFAGFVGLALRAALTQPGAQDTATTGPAGTREDGHG